MCWSETCTGEHLFEMWHEGRQKTHSIRSILPTWGALLDVAMPRLAAWQFVTRALNGMHGGRGAVHQC